MSQNGDVNQPTREFPEYAAGRAAAQPARPAAGSADDEPAGSGPADRSAPDGPQPEIPEPAGGRRGPGTGLFWLVGLIGMVVVAALLVQSVDLLPSWRNPFTKEVTDRSQPPLLKSIQDLSRYVAAEGNFEVVIDLQKDRRYIPDFLLGERILFVGAGTVESYVDFAKISQGAVVESVDRKSVEITLPAPQLGEVNLDLKRSYVFAEKRGLINHVGEVFGGDPNRQREVYLKAEERIAASARDSGLGERAQQNTRKMLDGLLHSLGYETVTINYVAA